jgi:hypothetical protein
MILAPLGDVPEDPRGVGDVGDAQSPGLLRRWTQQLDAERIRQVETFEVRPPGVQVVDHQLHHAVLGPLLLETSLQNEGRPADGKNGHVAVEEFLKAERLVKRAASLEVLACVARPRESQCSRVERGKRRRLVIEDVSLDQHLRQLVHVAVDVVEQNLVRPRVPAVRDKLAVHVWGRIVTDEQAIKAHAGPRSLRAGGTMDEDGTTLLLGISHRLHGARIAVDWPGRVASQGKAEEVDPSGFGDLNFGSLVGIGRVEAVEIDDGADLMAIDNVRDQMSRDLAAAKHLVRHNLAESLRNQPVPKYQEPKRNGAYENGDGRQPNNPSDPSPPTAPFIF